MKKALEVTSPFYAGSLLIGIILAFFLPVQSQAFVELAQKGSVSGAFLSQFVELKNPLMLVLSIFLMNFVIGGIGRFVLVPLLLYHVSYLLAVGVGFMFGFVIGSPSSLSYLTDFSSFGTVLYMLMLILENVGFITCCAVGYEVGKDSQEGLTTRDFLKLLLFPVHLSDAKRRETIKTGLRSNIQWILLSMVFFILGAFFETWLIIHYR